MVFGNGKAKPAPVREVREKFPNVPVRPPLSAYEPEEHRNPLHEPVEEPSLPVVRMNSLAKEIERDRIREMALLTSDLTYGEMVKLEETMKAAGAPPDLDLKPILHKWALAYLKKDDPHD